MKNTLKITMLAALTSSFAIASEGGRKKRFTLDDELNTVRGETEQASTEAKFIEEKGNARKRMLDDAGSTKNKTFDEYSTLLDQMREDFNRGRDEIHEKEVAAQKQLFKDQKEDLESDTVKGIMFTRDREKAESEALFKQFQEERDRIATTVSENDFNREVKTALEHYFSEQEWNYASKNWKTDKERDEWEKQRKIKVAQKASQTIDKEALFTKVPAAYRADFIYIYKWYLHNIAETSDYYRASDLLAINPKLYKPLVDFVSAFMEKERSQTFNLTDGHGVRMMLRYVPVKLALLLSKFEQSKWSDVTKYIKDNAHGMNSYKNVVDALKNATPDNIQMYLDLIERFRGSNMSKKWMDDSNNYKWNESLRLIADINPKHIDKIMSVASRMHFSFERIGGVNYQWIVEVIKGIPFDTPGYEAKKIEDVFSKALFYTYLPNSWRGDEDERYRDEALKLFQKLVSILSSPSDVLKNTQQDPITYLNKLLYDLNKDENRLYRMESPERTRFVAEAINKAATESTRFQYNY